MMTEDIFSFLKRNAVDNTFSLHALQTGFDDLPLGRVDHEWHFGNIRFRGHQMQKFHHGLFGVQQAFIHVNVNHLRSALHLLQSHAEGLLQISFTYEFSKLRGSSNVGSLTDIDKIAVRPDDERL